MKRSIQVLFNSDFELKHKKDKGVYSIYFLGTDKFYIGSTSGKDGFYGRWRLHITALRNNKHINSILQRVYNEYGEDFLRFKIIEICSNTSEYVLNREQFYIDSLKPTININQIATGCKFPEKWVSPLAKPILQYDLKGNFIREYVSINEAEKTVNADIIQSLRKSSKYSTQAGGYQWRYKTDDNIPLKIEAYKFSREITILCYNSKGDFIKEYPSIAQASKELNLEVGNISKNIRGLIRSCNGFFFKEKISNDYPLHIEDILRLHKKQLCISIEDLETNEKYYFDSMRKIPSTLLSRYSLQPYIKKGIKEFIFKRNVTKKMFKIKIQNYNEI